jgi:CDP-diacylglycerol--glycerol-3-phosphate 3-phosphatidyltransferase
MLNPPNSLSLLRAPLAFVFLSENTTLRTLSVIIALLSDCVDGYLARKYKYTSKLGAILDPLMDKFFVFFVLIIFVLENKLLTFEAILMASRDLFLFLFGGYLLTTKSLKKFQIQSVRWGKVTTGMQFCIIFLLIYNIKPPSYAYSIFTIVGFLVFVELFKVSKKTS